MSKPTRLAGLLFFLTVAGVAGAANAIDAAGRFTFRDAEFMAVDQGVDAATEFIQAALPPGIPLGEARRRLVRADMNCAAPTRCDFSEPVHIEGGLIGEDHYVVRLAVDGRGNLASASLRHFTVGVGQPNP